MKTKLLPILFILCAIAGHAQIQITRQDFPMVGDTFRFQTTELNALPNYQTKGANQTWDFSTITGGENLTIRYIARSAWTGVDSFPTSTLVEQSNHGTRFYSEDNNTIRLVGKIDSLVLGFQPPIVIARFPIAFNSTSTSSGTTITSGLYDTDLNDGNDDTNENPDNGDGNGDGNENTNFDSVRTNTLVVHTDTADAWGTIKTPAGQYQVLRIKSHHHHSVIYQRRSEQTGWTNYQPAGVPGIPDTVEYKWWAKGIRKEVFKVKISINSSSNTSESPSVTNNIEEVAWYTGTGAVTAAKNKLQETAIQCAPNPSNGMFVVSAAQESPEGYALALFDPTGRQLYADRMLGINKSINWSFLPDGLYNLRITDHEGNFLVKRIMIAK